MKFAVVVVGLSMLVMISQVAPASAGLTDSLNILGVGGLGDLNPASMAGLTNLLTKCVIPTVKDTVKDSKNRDKQLEDIDKILKDLLGEDGNLNELNVLNLPDAMEDILDIVPDSATRVEENCTKGGSLIENILKAIVDDIIASRN